nr:MAG TPA: hypothetical protein [Caudoviricetes sp.]
MFRCENFLMGGRSSPRIRDGKIYWYEGDTFTWSLKFTIKQCDGTDYILQPTDKIIVDFKKNLHTDKSIYTFIFENQEYTDNTIKMEFTPEITALFPYGFYKIGVKLESEDITTLLPASTICVENTVSA